MSLVTYNQLNQLTADVLLVIFDNLDVQDLLRCELVCRQWRNVLLSGRPRKTLFHRKIVSSPQWRHVLQNFEVGVVKLGTVNYRALCRAIIQQLNEIYTNWRTGNFEQIEETIVLPQCRIRSLVVSNRNYGSSAQEARNSQAQLKYL